MSRSDKTKSSAGGIFGTLLGRQKPKGYGANGGRPVSSEPQYEDEQDFNAEVLRMTVEEVNRKFVEVIDDMNIPPDKRKPLLEKNLDEKRKMLIMNLKKGKQT